MEHQEKEPVAQILEQGLEAEEVHAQSSQEQEVQAQSPQEQGPKAEEVPAQAPQEQGPKAEEVQAQDPQEQVQAQSPQEQGPKAEEVQAQGPQEQGPKAEEVQVQSPQDQEVQAQSSQEQEVQAQGPEEQDPETQELLAQGLEAQDPQEQDQEITDSSDSDTPPGKKVVISFQNPMTIKEEGTAKGFSFQVIVEDGGDMLPLAMADHVRRSFLDFMWLKETLKLRHDPEEVPRLRKKFRMEYKVEFYYTIKQRSSMSDFTDACFKHKEISLDPLLALFYESDLDISELEEFVNGEREDDDEFLAEIWAKHGRTKEPEMDYWDKVTSDEYYEEFIRKPKEEEPPVDPVIAFFRSLPKRFRRYFSTS